MRMDARTIEDNIVLSESAVIAALDALGIGPIKDKCVSKVTFKVGLLTIERTLLDENGATAWSPSGMPLTFIEEYRVDIGR